MGEYEFELAFALTSVNADVDDLIERLGAAGCDDAAVGLGWPGHVALSFLREGPDAETVLASALSDVRRAVPDARLMEASPDLVGVTDVADLLGVSRQNVRKLILTRGAPVPDRVHGGRPTIWRLAKVLEWLRDEKACKFAPDILELAHATMQVNLAVGARDADRVSQREFGRLVS